MLVSTIDNFITLQEFCVDWGKSDLAHHMTTATRNAKYTSGTIQNELINIIHDLIREQILDHVRDSKVLLCDCW